LNETQANEVIERIGYSAGIGYLIIVFGVSVVAITMMMGGLVWYEYVAIYLVAILSLITLVSGLIYAITRPVLTGLSWTKAAPEPYNFGDRLRKLYGGKLYGGFFTTLSTPWLIFFVLLFLIGLPSNLNTIYEALASGRIGWEAIGSAGIVLLTIGSCWVLLMRLKASRMAK
jgi:hypothetical protein